METPDMNPDGSPKQGRPLIKICDVYPYPVVQEKKKMFRITNYQRPHRPWNRKRGCMDSAFACGQAEVEMAFIITTVLAVIIVGVEGAVLGKRAFSLTQLAYQGARYAAVNPAYGPTTITNYVLQFAPAQIDQNSGAQLKVNVSPTSIPRVTGTSVTATIMYIRFRIPSLSARRCSDCRFQKRFLRLMSR